MNRLQTGAAFFATTMLFGGCSGNSVPDDLQPYVRMADNKLPPIMDPDWDNTRTDKSGIIYSSNEVAAEAIADEHAGPDNAFTDYFSYNLPPEYDAAFRATLQNPVVQLAARKGLIKGVTIVPVRKGADNGIYYYETRNVELQVPEGDKSRLYVDELAMVATGIHEATHGLTATWTYNPKEADSEEVKSVNSACSEVRDIVFERFVKNHKDELAQTFNNIAQSFKEGLKDGKLSGYKIGAEQKAKIRKYISALRATSKALINGTPDMFERLDEYSQGCEFIDFSSLPWVVTGTDMGAYDEYKETKGLDKYFAEQRDDVNAAYSCIRDGNAISDLLGEKIPRHGGHSYDNSSELASSLVTTLLVNPKYLFKCMVSLEKEDPELAESLWGALKSVQLANDKFAPELRRIMDAQPSTRDAIVQLENK